MKGLLALGLGTLVAPLDSALNPAFPAITTHFGLALPDIQWLVITYMLAYGSLMLGAGRLGDIFGHASVFRAGLGVSTLAYLLCAAAPAYGWLLAGRVAQGIGAALVISCGPALITGLYPEKMRARMLGLYALIFAAGGALGPALGGVLVTALGWPVLFWARAPLALLALLLSFRLPARPRTGLPEPFDLPGAVLLALASGSLLLALTQVRSASVALPLAALFAMALAGFLHRSVTAPRPVIMLAHFRRPGFARVNAANLLANLAGFAVLLLLPYYLARIAGLPLGLAGLVVAASPLGTMLASGPTGWLLGRYPAWRIAPWGAALSGVALGAIALWEPGWPQALLVACLLVQGAGQGLLQVAYTEIVTATMPPQDRGVAGSLTMMTRNFGIVASAALLSLCFDQWQTAALAAGAGAEDAFLQGFGAGFGLASGLGCVAALLLWRHPPAAG